MEGNVAVFHQTDQEGPGYAEYVSRALGRKLLVLWDDRNGLARLQVLEDYQEKIVDGLRNRDLTPIGSGKFGLTALDQLAKDRESVVLGLRRSRSVLSGRKPYLTSKNIVP